MSAAERFDCHYCKDSLLGNKYVMKEDTQYCTKCYESLFSNCCADCTAPIGCNSKVKSFDFHAFREQTNKLQDINNKSVKEKSKKT